MPGFIRRVVTGHDKSGKAIVISDGLAPVVKTNPIRPGYRGTDIWKTNAAPAPITADEPDPTLGPRTLHPAPQGTVIRITELAPETEELRNLSADKVRSVFAAAGAEAASTFKPGARHPLMHRTETIDYAVVLEGEITLVLDDEDVVLKAGDVVIQRGNNHSWSNRSDKMCRMLYVLIDGRFDPELAALFDSDAGH
jgi:quercetin dioxygenase-like cupin family protein